MSTSTACPCCGAYSIGPGVRSSSLLAVCDVLVLKALETMGKWILRADRSRFREYGDRPTFEAHTIWPPDEGTVRKATRGAWDVVPAMLDAYGCCGVTPVSVTTMLDEYVRDLTITGTVHSVDELRYRFQSRLGLDVPGGTP